MVAEKHEREAELFEHEEHRRQGSSVTFRVTPGAVIQGHLWAWSLLFDRRQQPGNYGGLCERVVKKFSVLACRYL
jgi:hypothetical protein